MTPQEVYVALKEELRQLRLDLLQWLKSLDSRLAEAEKAIVRIDERERVARSFSAPWYRAFAQALLSGLVGAIAAALALLAGLRS